MKAKNYIYRRSLKVRIMDWFWKHGSVQVALVIALAVIARILTDNINLFWWGIGE